MSSYSLNPPMKDGTHIYYKYNVTNEYNEETIG